MISSMRLVSYNILEGLRPIPSAATDRRLIDRERAAAVKAVVADLAPDILVLNEALFCRLHAGRAVDYGELFDYPHQAAALYDHAWGNAILSRFPIAKSQEMRIYNRGGLVATIVAPTGQLSIASYHPHPGRYPENKADDFTRLVGNVSGPLIVCGDMNCISPEDAVDRNSMIEAFGSFSNDPKTAVDRFIQSGKLVFSALGEIGFRDAVPSGGRRYTMPTDLINSDKQSAMRIDHILANNAIDVVSGKVIHSPDSNRASDHHPVMIDFRILAA
jgi:endonuclease/exonuclease/phosphatase family metal-dependent hydrolase